MLLQCLDMARSLGDWHASKHRLESKVRFCREERPRQRFLGQSIARAPCGVRFWPPTRLRSKQTSSTEALPMPLVVHQAYVHVCEYGEVLEPGCDLDSLVAERDSSS